VCGLPLKLIAEVSPGRIHGIDPYLPWVTELADAIDIPESPLGEPHPSAVGVAAFLKGRYDAEVYPHVRVRDLSVVALASKAYLVRILRINGLVLLRGEGAKDSCLSLTTEEAARKLRSFKGLKDLRLGAILSLKFSSEKILERGLNQHFNFFLLLRFSPSLSEGLINALSRIRSENKQVYAYVLIASELNKGLVAGLNQPYIKEGDAYEFINGVEGLVDGVVLSVPKDWDGLRRVLTRLRRR